MGRGPRSKIDKYDLGEKVLRLANDGLTIRKITEKLLADGSIPSGVGVSHQAVGTWIAKQRKQTKAVDDVFDIKRLDRLIAFLEDRLKEDNLEKPPTLESQVRGALAIGKLVELKLKFDAKGSGDKKEGAATNLSDLLSGMDEE